jgi:hypothetical protein
VKERARAGISRLQPCSVFARGGPSLHGVTVRPWVRAGVLGSSKETVVDTTDKNAVGQRREDKKEGGGTADEAAVIVTVMRESGLLPWWKHGRHGRRSLIRSRSCTPTTHERQGKFQLRLHLRAAAGAGAGSPELIDPEGEASPDTAGPPRDQGRSS